jgi:asparagine synthase (glutamine-hydrolysing)
MNQQLIQSHLLPSSDSTVAVALRVTDTLAGWVDLRNLENAAEPSCSAIDDIGVSTLSGSGFAVGACGRHSGLRQEGAIVCVAVGSPRFDSRGVADAAAQQGAAAGWLALYRDFGPEMSARAHGAWSVVVVDRARRQIVAAVDRFAMRPFCFRFDAGILGFASRADQVPGQSDEIDAQALFNYVYHHAIPAPRTIFKDVSRLDAAHRPVAAEEGIRVERHWHPRFAPQDVPFAERRETFLSALSAAVSDQLAGESIGCYLSGGTDSSTVAGMVARITGKPVKTFSIGFDAAGYDEMHYARIAAKAFGTDHREYYVTPGDLLERIPDVAAFYDQPFDNSSALPAYFCAKHAHDGGVMGMLAGDGGDELFGGNSRYAADKLFTVYELVPDVLKRSLIEPIALGLSLRWLPVARKGARYVEIARLPVPGRLQLHNLLMRLGPETIFTPEFLAEVDVGEPHRRELETYAATPPTATLDRMLAYEWKHVLADNDLPKVVGTAALGGVDVGFPPLDDRLLDFSLSLPPDLKVRGRKLRYFFKEALRGLLPDEIIAKKKHGFGLPFGVWLQRTPALRDVAHDAVDALERRGIIRPRLRLDLLDGRIGEHAGYYGEMIWVLMMLKRWLSRPAVAGRHPGAPLLRAPAPQHGLTGSPNV